MSSVGSGPSTMDRPPVFDLPELQTLRQRVMYSALTFTAWIVWAYLWLPLLTALGWFLGFRVFVREIVVPDASDLVGSALLYLTVIALLAMVLVAWSRYNLVRFGRRDRRRAREPVTDDEIQRWFEVSPQDHTRLRECTSVRIEHDEHGTIVGILAEPAPPDPAAATDAEPPAQAPSRRRGRGPERPWRPRRTPRDA